jgi:hypothetical protein
MTKQTWKHFATSVLLLGFALSASPSLAQSLFIGSHSRGGQRTGQRPGSLAGRSSLEQPLVPGTLSVINFGAIDFPGAPDSAAFNVNNKG